MGRRSSAIVIGPAVLSGLLLAAACTGTPSPNERTTPTTAAEGTAQDTHRTGASPTMTTQPPSTTAPSTTQPPTTLPTIEFGHDVGFGQLLIRAASPGATVTVSTVDGTEVGRTVIEADGTALVRDLPPGEFRTHLVDGGDRVAQGPTVVLPTDAPPPQEVYDRQDLDPGFGYIETRDGTTLSALVTLPGPPAAGPYPTLIEYSGYQPSNPGADDPSRLIIPALGYALVQVNVRGTGCSGGSFDPFEPIQDLDGYDVIETVAAQSWSANVGMWGISYPGIMQLHVAATRPPSLAAIAALSPLDRIESVLLPGGVLNQGFGREWTLQVGDRANAFGQSWTRTRSDAGDTICAANQTLRRFNPDFVTLLAESSDRTPQWDSRSAEPTAADIDVPVFIAGAWQDEQTGGRFPALLDDLASAPVLRAHLYNGLHPDPLGPAILPRVLEFYDFYVAERRPGIGLITRIGTELALASVFGAPVRLEPDRFEGRSYTAARASYEAESPIRILFEVGADRPALPQARWEASFDAWPIPEVVPRRWYLTGSGSLADDAPSSPTGSTDTNATFTTDADEGLRSTAPDLDRLWTDEPGWQWPESDERLTFTTAPLSETLVMAGTASVDLWVGADAPDAAVEASITEIAPDGTETFVQAGWLRLSRRVLDDASTELRPIPSLLADDRRPLEDDQPVLARMEILPFAHVFRPGSQIRLTIDTPGGNSARWRFAVDDDVEVTVVSNADQPSSVVLPVVPGLRAPDGRPPCGSLRGQPCRALD